MNFDTGETPAATLRAIADSEEYMAAISTGWLQYAHMASAEECRRRAAEWDAAEESRA